ASAVSGGVATFNSLSINRAGAGYSLSAADGALGSATSTLFTVSAAAADHLAFSVQPGDTTAGVSISPPVRVQVLDAFGNLVSSDTSTVTVAIASNPGGGTLSGSTTATVSGGTATFANLSINRAGSGYSLAATDAALGGATSDPFNIASGAHHLVFG